MTVLLLLFSALVAFVGFDMLRLRTTHRISRIKEDEALYGSQGRNLTVEKRAILERFLRVSPLNLRPAVAIALAVSGSIGVATSIYKLAL
jgi:hypothetical protein